MHSFESVSLKTPQPIHLCDDGRDFEPVFSNGIPQRKNAVCGVLQRPIHEGMLTRASKFVCHFSQLLLSDFRAVDSCAEIVVCLPVDPFNLIHLAARQLVAIVMLAHVGGAGHCSGEILDSRFTAPHGLSDGVNPNAGCDGILHSILSFFRLTGSFIKCGNHI